MTKTNETPIEIRVLQRNDLDALLVIDAETSGKRRSEMLKHRIERALDQGRVTTSLVAESGGRVVGFVVGDVLVGEFGATERSATIDTIGVTPALKGKGIARRLLRTYVNHVRALGVERVQTMVSVSDSELLRFFSRASFRHAQTVPLELDLSSLQPGQWDDADC